MNERHDFKFQPWFLAEFCYSWDLSFFVLWMIWHMYYVQQASKAKINKTCKHISSSVNKNKNALAKMAPLKFTTQCLPGWKCSPGYQQPCVSVWFGCAVTFKVYLFFIPCEMRGKRTYFVFFWHRANQHYFTIIISCKDVTGVASKHMLEKPHNV